MNSKEASGKACEIWLKWGLHGNFSNTLQTWIDHVAMFEKLPYPSVTSMSVILNVLPHVTKLCKHG